MAISCLRLHFLLVLLLSYVFASSILMINALVVRLPACRPDQIRALVQFKNEFESRGCNNSDYFHGVMCDNTTGAITKLKLPSGCLTGILKPNSSLFELHHLRHLDLSSNNFTSSSLPSGFSNLNRLEVLYLSSNGFIGQVPSSFSNLSQLSYLDLSNNELTGSFNLVWNLSELSFLDLSFNHFSGTLNPSSSLFELHHLIYLDLADNNLVSSSIPSEFGNLKRLEVLSLSNNGLHGQLPSSFGNLSRLKFLSLQHSELTGTLEPISKLINLKTLDLSFQNMSYPVDLNIFSSLKSLLLLDLSGFEGSGDVLQNSSVKILDLALNHFKGPFPNPPHSLNVLSAWNNSFTGSIPLAICNQTMLALLDLSYNNFTGSIPPCLSNFQTSLIVVNLRKNNLEGSLPDMCCNDGVLLRTLDAGFNRLTGKLPRSLLNCTSLKFLSVDNNKIKDTFPLWLKGLPYLQALTLRSNRFYGPLSPSDQGLFAFPELRILEVSYNNFTGSLPPNYFVNWKASSQNEDGMLYMGDNSIPDYNYEDTIDLQYKGLFMEQGKVLTSYATIDFSGNRLEGQIPESIGLLKTLIALNLSNNAFTGNIPLSLSNVSELESLDLSGNQLTGTIPKGLERLSYLVYISVAHNKLKGEIPQGTQITGQPKSSFEGNSGLCGLPLEQSCFGTNAPPMQQQPEEEKEEEEEVLNWKAVAIGYGTGMLLGLLIAQVIASYKPEWLVKITGLYKCRTC
ncbi:hypothetical protein N665_4801s0001 [Sinapis alba]|nr:hypothetical protein N665_4801s0001 [Sinapis alba]